MDLYTRKAVLESALQEAIKVSEADLIVGAINDNLVVCQSFFVFYAEHETEQEAERLIAKLLAQLVVSCADKLGGGTWIGAYAWAKDAA